ncbi:hypothetical protein AB0465_13625 [Streptomyces griseoviridis]|uniref:SCO2400 family protein n=1 Tax=Streptomyces griseoviridis TaxID=45398 RepID=UPI00344DB46C
MDYCSTCRRHLNGALVCPGCGAYAPDIAPRTTVSAYGSGLAPEAPEPEPLPHADDIVDAPVVAAGRAARRRQLARWKKNKRRAAVATAVALVGGGLSVAAMNRQPADRAQADAAPDTRGMGGAEERTEPVGPSSTPPSTHRTTRVVTPAAPSTAADGPHGRSASASRTALKLVPSGKADTSARTPSPAGTTADAARLPDRGQRSAVTETSDPAEETSASSPSDTGASDSGARQPSSTPDTSRTPEASESADPADSAAPAKLCLLVICLG